MESELLDDLKRLVHTGIQQRARLHRLKRINRRKLIEVLRLSEYLSELVFQGGFNIDNLLWNEVNDLKDVINDVLIEPYWIPKFLELTGNEIKILYVRDLLQHHSTRKKRRT